MDNRSNIRPATTFVNHRPKSSLRRFTRHRMNPVSSREGLLELLRGQYHTTGRKQFLKIADDVSKQLELKLDGGGGRDE